MRALREVELERLGVPLDLLLCGVCVRVGHPARLARYRRQGLVRRVDEDAGGRNG